VVSKEKGVVGAVVSVLFNGLFRRREGRVRFIVLEKEKGPWSTSKEMVQ